MKKLKPSISFESHPVSGDKAKKECADAQDFPSPPDRLSPSRTLHSDFIVFFSLIKAPSFWPFNFYRVERWIICICSNLLTKASLSILIVLGEFSSFTCSNWAQLEEVMPKINWCNWCWHWVYLCTGLPYMEASKVQPYVVCKKPLLLWWELLTIQQNDVRHNYVSNWSMHIKKDHNSQVIIGHYWGIRVYQ